MNDITLNSAAGVRHLHDSFGDRVDLLPSVFTTPAAPSFMSRPTLEELTLIGAKIGIEPGDCEALWNKWQGNGWKNGGKAIVSIPHTMAAWKAYGYLPSQVRNKSNGKSTFALKSAMEAKEQEAKEIYNKHASQAAMDTHWDDPQQRQRYIALRMQVKQLRSQLGELAL